MRLPPIVIFINRLLTIIAKREDEDEIIAYAESNGATDPTCPDYKKLHKIECTP